MTRRALLAWAFLPWSVLVNGSGPWTTHRDPGPLPAWARQERVVLPTRQDCQAVARYMDQLVELYGWGAKPTPCEETDE